MMEDKTYLVKIASRFDTDSDWKSIDPVLLEGEAAIVSIPSDIPNSFPEVRIKVGDGVHKYSELTFISAHASDVYNWAKQRTKPTYSADEIIGLEDFKHQHTIEDIIDFYEQDHKHTIDDIINLDEYKHLHSIKEIVDLDDYKHKHSIEDLTDLNNFKHRHNADEIDGIIEYDHKHTIDDIEGLREELDRRGDYVDPDNSTNGNVGENGQILAAEDGGIKITQSGDDVIIGLNKSITFIFDGGTSSQFRS